MEPAAGRAEIPQGIKMIQAPELWNQGHKGEGVVIAVIDSGCDVNHPDLKDRVIDKHNFVPSEGKADDVTDHSGHGTHVAGTIAAAENGAGVIGVAPKAELVILKVMQRIIEQGQEEFGASNQSIINAIRLCINWNKNGKRIRVINMSLGGKDNDPELHKAIQDAVNHDILVVCAAGNEGELRDGGDCGVKNDELSYPGAYPEVLEVGAVGLDGRFPCFTNTNLELDLVAPGVNIQSTWPGGNYMAISGTSMASPHVAGAAALIINLCEDKFDRTFTEPEIYAQLIKRTDFRDEDPKLVGNGLLNLNNSCSTNTMSNELKQRELVTAH
ncbi:S8 family peptidase [Paenibacillus pinihumi]|uniref:S8 family peptidase n=1 Tax=Paenibacillus pinihumi TaxID=669462 RepID=UPI0006846D54